MSNNYFTSTRAKASRLASSKVEFSSENSRTELLATEYEAERKRIFTPEMLKKVDLLYKRWCDLLFLGYNVIVTGPNSKFKLLETFKKRYLDSGRLRDLTSPVKRMLNITVVRLHGLEPIELETFCHAVLDIKETRRIKESDYLHFSQMVKRDQIHYVFMIHSIEYLLESCENVCDVIFKLYATVPNYVHLLASSDRWNGGIRLKNLQHNLRLVYSESVIPGIDTFLWEKSQLVGDFELLVDAKANDTTLHRLFADNYDLQSMKDIHLALPPPTQEILAYILKDFIDKSEINANQAGASTKRKRFRGLDVNDDEEHELNDEEKADENMPMRLTRRASKMPDTKTNQTSRAPKTSSINLEFNHLFKHLSTKFLVRRANALRDHLGELKDHNLIEYEDSDNKIKCLVDIDVAKKFLAWVGESMA